MVIALTGVTGHLGGYLAREMSNQGIDVRLLARRPQAVEKLPHTQVFESYYDSSAVTVNSIEGVDVLFMVSAREAENRVDEHKAFLDAAKRAGVRHIVYTSFLGASAHSTFTYARDHAATEEYIKKQGFTYTFIRDNFYMDFFIDLCREYGEIKGPAGRGKVSAVVRQDVAEVVLAVLQDSSRWENQVLNMTGPEALTMQEIADVIGERWGKNLRYVEESVDEAYESRKAWPAEQWEYDGWVSTYTAIAQGELAEVSHDVERVLGRPATSLTQQLQRVSR